MKSFYPIAIFLIAFSGATYWYQSTANICPVPLSYRLGDVDESFGISEAEALQFVTKAETYWEDAADRDLFKYDEDSEFTIDFVFDERQASANNEENQRDVLDKKREKNEEVRDTIVKLQSEYQALLSDYQSDVEFYENSLSRYNSKVNKYNDRGGAPPDVFKELEDEREELEDESEDLNETAEELNDFSLKINDLSDLGNSLVEEYNREVNAYNDKFGFAREFTQGDYHNRNIRIYKFSTEEELVTVLAHEFGHALGIDHVEGNSSLMYYLLEDTESLPVLSEKDMSALKEVCGETESLEQKVRRIIRELL